MGEKKQELELLLSSLAVQICRKSISELKQFQDIPSYQSPSTRDASKRKHRSCIMKLNGKKKTSLTTCVPVRYRYTARTREDNLHWVLKAHHHMDQEKTTTETMTHEFLELIVDRAMARNLKCLQSPIMDDVTAAGIDTDKKTK
ncbi:tRNA N6-adenosine threonylcarbamoyltransferase [Striga asiatica]|uniref:tRNA N6-adenosine threonylcarbamoyltransferase n=1 Tax=Striga asiatica TaxID=4170 RepID=A0A5A7P2D4_STRAF|nr:tRNA N6-adenosine threonylcarbamoyltransferase [Striga asiatica]